MNPIFRTLLILGIAVLIPGLSPSVQAQQTSTSKNQQTAEYYNNLGLSRFRQRDYQGAINAYNQAIKLNRNFAIAYSNRGDAKARLGDQRGANQDFHQAINLNPRLAAWNNIPGRNSAASSNTTNSLLSIGSTTRQRTIPYNDRVDVIDLADEVRLPTRYRPGDSMVWIYPQ